MSHLRACTYTAYRSLEHLQTGHEPGPDQTSEAVARAARESDVDASAPRMHGEDASWSEAKEALKEEGVGHMIGHGVKDVAVHMVEHALKVENPILEVVEVAAHVVGAFKKSDEQAAVLNKALRLDQQHVAVLASIYGLPPGFRAEEARRYSVVLRDLASLSGRNVDALKVAIATTPGLQTQLQHRADEGMYLAVQAFAAGADPRVYARVHDRSFFARDPAFHVGVEAMTWAKANDPAAYEQAVRELEARQLAGSMCILRAG